MSPFTVSGELGHGSREMVERIYDHLGTIRQHPEVVEYRVTEESGNIHAVTGGPAPLAKSLKRP